MKDLSDIKIRILYDQKLVWYASVMCALDVELGESPFKTAHTNGLKIVIDPDYAQSLPEKELMGLILHELRHVTDLHIARRGTRDPMLFNMAADYVINADIKSMGYSLPSGGLFDSKYDGMSAEEVYEDLLKQGKQPQMPQGLQDLQPDPDGQDEQGGNNPDTQAAQAKALEDAVRDIVIQATMQTQMQIDRTGVGSIPSTIQRLVDGWTNPVLPWQTVLRRYMSAKAKIDHSWRKPNKRYMSQRLYMPSLQGETMGPIHIFLDASGSVTDEQFAMQVAQFKWIHKNLKPSEMRIITFDTRIQQEYVFRPNETIKVDFTGKGGTCVNQIVKYMQDNPCLCNLIFTDGYFSQRKLEKIKGDVLCLIYDQKGFTWEGAKTIEITL